MNTRTVKPKIEKHEWFPGIIGVDGCGQYFTIYHGDVREHASHDEARRYLLSRKESNES